MQQALTQVFEGLVRVLQFSRPDLDPFGQRDNLVTALNTRRKTPSNGVCGWIALREHLGIPRGDRSVSWLYGRYRELVLAELAESSRLLASGWLDPVLAMG